MNRVDQIYEDELAIRMILINQTDKLNLNTAADMTERNGPCGGAACYTDFQASRLLGPAAQAQPDRARPDHRRRQLRHRAHRARPQRRRHRAARRRRPRREGVGLHRPADSGRRLHGRRLRGARDGPPVRRQPHLQRHAAQLLGRQPQRRRRRSSPARARRSWPTPASAARTTCSRTPTRTSRERSYDEITSYTSRERPPIDEVQTVVAARLRHQRRLVHARLRPRDHGADRARRQLHDAGHHGGAPGDHARGRDRHRPAVGGP